ncbi:MAG: bifunctional precorrin-2 dehydrogenase/sirohydrochlorin ferrochelatase [Eubacterium sp.]|nr:bifunctional precorrin-2 dehydrogenase/sirohydrochlorin ferrochelatase [Eubacterium sp.]
MAYFPMFVDLEKKNCLIVGGGEVAYRKLKVLREFGAIVTVAAPEICDAICSEFGADKSVILMKTEHSDHDTYECTDKKIFRYTDRNAGIPTTRYTDKYTDGKTDNASNGGMNKDTGMDTDRDIYFLVVAATDSSEMNHRISVYYRSRGIMVNAVDQSEDCSFIFPSYVKEGDLTAAFSSGGKSPLLTQMLRDAARSSVTPFMSELNDCLGSIRACVKKRIQGAANRKKLYREIYDRSVSEKRVPAEEEMTEIISRYEV